MSGTFSPPPPVRDKCPGQTFFFLYKVQLSHFNSLPNYFSSNLYFILFKLQFEVQANRSSAEDRSKSTHRMYVFLHFSLSFPSNPLFPLPHPTLSSFLRLSLPSSNRFLVVGPPFLLFLLDFDLKTWNFSLIFPGKSMKISIFFGQKQAG